MKPAVPVADILGKCGLEILSLSWSRNFRREAHAGKAAAQFGVPIVAELLTLLLVIGSWIKRRIKYWNSNIPVRPHDSGSLHAGLSRHSHSWERLLDIGATPPWFRVETGCVSKRSEGLRLICAGLPQKLAIVGHYNHTDFRLARYRSQFQMRRQ